MLTVADRGKGGKIFQNLADVICERSLTTANLLLTSIPNFNHFTVTSNIVLSLQTSMFPG